jgi:hypothetical protein
VGPRSLLVSCLLLFHPPALIGIGEPSARAAIIDSWQTPQQLATPPQNVQQVVSGPGIIGGSRGSDLFASGTSAGSSLTTGNGALSFAVDTAAPANGFLTVTWDGPPPGHGLGGVDVTDGGQATGFSVDVLQTTGDIRYAFLVADTRPVIGTAFGIIPGGSHDLHVFLPFSEFIGQSQPVLVDMTRVNKLQLQLEVPPGGEIVLGPIQTPVPLTVPEPTTLYLWGLVGLVGVARLRRGKPVN